MKNIIIETDITRIDKLKWQEFVLDHPNGNIFQTPEIFEVYQKTKNYSPIVIAALNNNNIRGILSAVTLKENSGILGKFSERTIVMGGPLIAKNDKEIGIKLLNALNISVKKTSIYTQFRSLFDVSFLDQEFIKEGFIHEDHLDILNNISDSNEAIISRLKRGAKKNYNKSKNKGLYIKLISEIDEIKASYCLVQETYKRIKIPYPDYEFFTNLFNVLHSKGQIKYFGAFHEEELIGVRVELVYKNIIYDYYAGSSEKHKNKYPNDFIPIEILLWGNTNNYTVFDFGGAGKPNIPYGVRDHKLKFGGELVNYGRYEKINNKLLFKLGKIAMRYWKLIS